MDNKSPKLDLKNFDVALTEDSLLVMKKGTDELVGEFPFKKSEVIAGGRTVRLPDFITMDFPQVKENYRGKGLGEQAYKLVEELTGMTILPDTALSESSKALHTKKGMGKSFGMEEYGPSVIKSLTEKLKKMQVENPQEAAERAFSHLKTKISKSIPEFKSVSPWLVKGAATAGGGLASLAAEAFDAEEEGSGQQESAMKREQEQEKLKRRMDSMHGKGAYENWMEKSAKEYTEDPAGLRFGREVSKVPQFTQLRNALRK